MGAAPLPKSDEPPAEPVSDAAGWALLESLRRRLDDQAVQGRKTQAQVGQLAESIGALVAEQRRRSLWLNVNSFVAYLVFTILCGAGCYLLYRSRARELTAAREQAVSERDSAVRRADEALARAVARESADARAWEVYQLLEAGQRRGAADKLAALRDQPLSKTERAVLAARVRETQGIEVDAALKAAAAAIKAGRPGDAIKPLEGALAEAQPGARAATIHYYLGLAYARTQLDRAVAHFQAAIASDVDQDDARFQLASVLDRSGAYAQARTEYDRFATAHPQSQLAVFAMRRSATLSRVPAAAPVPGFGRPAPAGGVAPGGAAPPPGQPAGLPAAPAAGAPPHSAPLATPPAAPPSIPPAVRPAAPPAAGRLAPAPGSAPTAGSGATSGGAEPTTQAAPPPHAGAAVPPAGASAAAVLPLLRAAPRPPLRQPLRQPLPVRPAAAAGAAAGPPAGSAGDPSARAL